MAGNNIVAALGPSYFLDDRKAAVQRAVNLYLKQIDGLGEARQLMMVSAPGLVAYLSLGMEIREQRQVEGRWFVVAGSILYEIIAGVATNRGTINSSSGTVGMSHNNTQLTIVDGADGWVLMLATNVFAQITSPGWLGSNTANYLDGYTIFVAPGTDQFYVAALDDSSTLDALDFSSADVQPDRIVRSLVLHRELILLGLYSTEIWINSGGALFPFQRYNSAQIDIGCVGRDAVIIASDAMFWIGQTRTGSGIVYKMVGHSPQRVSTSCVEQQLKTSTDLTQARMWTYLVDGHEFIGINAPGMGTTFVYDAATQQWSERAEWAAGYSAFRATSVCFVDGQHYAGDALGDIYRFDADVYQYGGDVVMRERTWPHLVSPSMEPITFKALELACTTGHGGQVSLELSNDGGFNFGPALLRSLGAVGRWMERIRWLPLGTARDRVFRVRCSDNVPFNVHAGAVDA